MYWLTGLLGIASAIAPFLMGYSDNGAAMWTSLTIGIVLVLVSAFEWVAEGRQAWEYWVAGIAGLTAIVAPFVLGFSALTVAVWTLVIIGVVAIIAAGIKLFPGRMQY